MIFRYIGCAIFTPLFLLAAFAELIIQGVGGPKVVMSALIVGVIVFFIWLIFSSGETPKPEINTPETPEEDPLAEQTVEVRIK